MYPVYTVHLQNGGLKAATERKRCGGPKNFISLHWPKRHRGGLCDVAVVAKKAETKGMHEGVNKLDCLKEWV